MEPVREKTLQVNNEEKTPVTETKPKIRHKIIRRAKGSPDAILLIVITALLAIGALMIFSSSYAYAEYRFGNSYHFIVRHLPYLGIGLFGMLVAMLFDYRVYQKIALPFFGIGILLLCLVLVIGFDANGANRWIDLGPIQLQPSEIMKLAAVLFFADYLSRHVVKGRDITVESVTESNSRPFAKFIYRICGVSSLKQLFDESVVPIAFMGLICGLTVLERHLSATIILFCICFTMMFLAKAPLLPLVGILGAGGVGAATIIFFTDYMSQRIATWLNPYLDPLGDGWQSIRSFMAIGSGGLFGVGFCNSTQKHMYLPEPYNDYIFSIFCEEFGFIGAMGLLLLFAVFVWRGFVISRKAPDSFSRLAAAGITCKIAIQVIFNIFVVTGLFPPTGISLPFISYGGTALVLLLAECGILLSISKYSYVEKT